MDPARLRELLEAVAAGTLGSDDAMESLAQLPVTDIEDAKIDHHRAVRCGFAEVVFCEGKSPSQVRAIAREMLEHGVGSSFRRWRRGLGFGFSMRCRRHRDRRRFRRGAGGQQQRQQERPASHQPANADGIRWCQSVACW